MIRAIVFDYGNVIDTVDMSRFVRAVTRNTQLSSAAVQTLLGHSSPLARQYESGSLSSDEFYDRLVCTHGLSVDKEDFFRAFNDVFSPIAPTHELIRKLKPRYRLGLLSNTNASHFERSVKTSPVFPLFDAVTVSFEAGVMKPAEGMFRSILSKLDVQPEESAYIDDLAENVDAARDIGMNGVLYRTPADLLASLQELQIECR